MKKKPSLQRIMRGIAAHVAALQENRPVKMGVLTAMDAFVTIDPVLGMLNKQLLDARHYHEKAEALHGKDSPMAQVAADMAASAESALQTRLIEVQQDKALRRAAVRTLRAHRALARQAALPEERPVLSARDALKAGADSFAASKVLLAMLEQALQRTQKMLSLAAAFESASRCPSVRAA